MAETLVIPALFITEIFSVLATSSNLFGVASISCGEENKGRRM